MAAITLSFEDFPAAADADALRLARDAHKIFVLPVNSLLRRAMPWLGWIGTSAAGDEIPHGNMSKLLLSGCTLDEAARALALLQWMVSDIGLNRALNVLKHLLGDGTVMSYTQWCIAVETFLNGATAAQLLDLMLKGGTTDFLELATPAAGETFQLWGQHLTLGDDCGIVARCSTYATSLGEFEALFGPRANAAHRAVNSNYHKAYNKCKAVFAPGIANNQDDEGADALATGFQAALWPSGMQSFDNSHVRRLVDVADRYAYAEEHTNSIFTKKLGSLLSVCPLLKNGLRGITPA